MVPIIDDEEAPRGGGGQGAEQRHGARRAVEREPSVSLRPMKSLRGSGTGVSSVSGLRQQLANPASDAGHISISLSPGANFVSIICVSGGTSLLFPACFGIIHHSLKRERAIRPVAFGLPTFHVLVDALSSTAWAQVGRGGYSIRIPARGTRSDTEDELECEHTPESPARHPSPSG